MTETSQEPLLTIKDLSVDFTVSGVTSNAVDKVSFDIGKGETVALVGESGSGKSVTALSVLKLLPYPSASHPSGTVMFKGEDLLDSDERDLRRVRGDDITMIFQEPMTSLNPVYTIGEQIAEVIRAHQGLSRNVLESRSTCRGTHPRVQPYSGSIWKRPHRAKRQLVSFW